MKPRRPTHSPHPQNSLLRGLLFVLTLHAGLLFEYPLFSPLFPVGIAYADDGDGDGGGGDGGGGAGGDGGGGGGDGGGGGGFEIDLAPEEDPVSAASETFIADEILALNPSAAALQRATALGMKVIERINTRSLRMSVVRLRLPPRLDAKSAQEILDEPGPGVFDLHHIYKLNQVPAANTCSARACTMQALIGWPAETRECGRNQSIGIVDTGVERGHPALSATNLRAQDFVTAGKTPAEDDHGTAVAALLVGGPETAFPGLVPRARLFAAAPFYVLPSGNATADTAGLVRSLDWLVTQGVRTIGLSLAGPDNRVLKAAVERVIASGIIVTAAAGNGGRNAPPAYPAAYDKVLGITAISQDRRIYWRANQGDYIDYALPGVNVWTAGRSEGRARSGTSYAVPFMVAIASQSVAQRLLDPGDLIAGRLKKIEDLGQQGRDPVFGHGIPRFDQTCR